VIIKNVSQIQPLNIAFSYKAYKRKDLVNAVLNCMIFLEFNFI